MRKVMWKEGKLHSGKDTQGKQDKKERNEYISIVTEMEEEELMKMQRFMGEFCGIQVDKSRF